ncbi:MAG: sulfotransferase family 2 domain-containing protein [Planctomycetota bacterium]|nr:sulfotransferase family 2 domain-containing protein [Planctomycetota bacterium]
MPAHDRPLHAAPAGAPAPLPLSDRQAAENALFPWADVYTFPGRPLVVWAIPKAGCSAVKRWLLGHAEPGPEDRWAPDVHTYIRPRYSIKLLDDAERARRLASDRTLAFVRDPIARVVSAYVDKFVIRDHDHLFAPAREMTALLGARGLTFRQFVDILTHTPDDHLDVHWRPQTRWFAIHTPAEILPIERLSATLAALDADAGIPAAALPHLAKPSNPTEYTRSDGVLHTDTPSDVLKARDLRPGPVALVDDDTRAAILRRFADDLDLYRRAVGRTSP